MTRAAGDDEIGIVAFEVSGRIRIAGCMEATHGDRNLHPEGAQGAEVSPAAARRPSRSLARVIRRLVLLDIGTDVALIVRSGLMMSRSGRAGAGLGVRSRPDGVGGGDYRCLVVARG